MDWSPYFPAYVSSPTSSAADSGHGDGEIRPLIKPVTAADVGCGFGGLLVALSPLLADELILGILAIAYSAPSHPSSSLSLRT